MTTLIDSSAWMDCLRGKTAGGGEVISLLEAGHATLCPPVWVELWRGAKGKREEAALLRLRDLCGMLAIDDETWEIMGRLSRASLRSGLNCPFADILIVACARRHQVRLLHTDKHMDALQKL
ncbi:MAG: PIN domain-containing protein [Luteolibacter sp.]